MTFLFKKISSTLISFIPSTTPTKEEEVDKASSSLLPPPFLSDELWVLIFSHLSIPDLTSASLACWKWKLLSDDKLLWKRIVRRDYPGFYPAIQKGVPVKNEYKRFHFGSWVDDKVFSETDRINCIHATSNSLITGSQDGLIRIWDFEREKVISTLKGHTGPIRFFKEYQNLLLSASNDGTVRFWDLEKKICAGRFGAKEDCVMTVLCQGDLVFSGHASGAIHVWNFSKKSHVTSFHKHTDWVLCFHLDENKLLSGSADRSICIWDLEKKELVQTLQGHSNWVVFLYRNKQELFVSGSLDNTLKFWNLKEENPLKTLNLNPQNKGQACLYHSMYLKNEELLSASKSTHSVSIWNLEKEICTHSFCDFLGNIEELHRDEETIFIATNKMLYMWNVNTNSRKTLQLPLAKDSKSLTKIQKYQDLLFITLGNQVLIKKLTHLS